VLFFGLFVDSWYYFELEIIIYYVHSMHTIDTIMPEIPNLRVHIAPVGYEIDRIVLPARKYKADKVILLAHNNKKEDLAVKYKFYEKITLRLKKLRIDVVQEDHNRLDLFQIIKTVKNLFEREKGNTIYVNLASGSKVQAIGCMMACMMFNDDKNVNPFYAEAKKYPGFSGKPISEGIENLEFLPTYEIQRPEQRLIDTLKIIVDKGGEISKKEMARLAKEQKLIVVNAENENQATYASLDKNIISPLKNKWKFISVNTERRSHYIKLTEAGKHASEFLI